MNFHLNFVSHIILICVVKTKFQQLLESVVYMMQQSKHNQKKQDAGDIKWKPDNVTNILYYISTSPSNPGISYRADKDHSHNFLHFKHNKKHKHVVKLTHDQFNKLLIEIQCKVWYNLLFF